MTNTFKQLWADDAGVVISAELVLVMTIAVLSLIVGLNELAAGVVSELADVSDAIGHLDQSYSYTSFRSLKLDSTDKSRVSGSAFKDEPDSCDNCSGIADVIECNQPDIGECTATP